MLGGHERDRRRAWLAISLFGASLTIRHGAARFPQMGGLDNLTLRVAAAEHQAARRQRRPHDRFWRTRAAGLQSAPAELHGWR